MLKRTILGDTSAGRVVDRGPFKVCDGVDASFARPAGVTELVSGGGIGNVLKDDGIGFWIDGGDSIRTAHSRVQSRRR